MLQNLTTRNGTHLKSPGWGGILINVDNNIHLLAPVYYCPHNPRNTLSTTSLVQYCGYDSAIVNTNKYLEIIDTQMRVARLPFDVSNDLDHLNLTIMTMTTMSDSHKIIAAATLRRSPRLAMNPSHQSDDNSTKTTVDHNPNIATSVTKLVSKEKCNTSSPTSTIKDKVSSQYFDILIDDDIVATIPRSVMAKIAAYTVLLEHPSSPRDVAIKTMNSLLGNYFNSMESSSRQIHQSPSHHEQILVPVIANFSRNTCKSNSTHDWIRFHFGMLHNSKSTLDPIIKNNLLLDLPASLKTTHPPICSCFICAKSKAVKKNRGPPVDKSHLRPFERLHIDFSFFGVTSIRGFTSALDITCGATSYPLGFPGKAKTPPIETVKWVISTI